MIISSLWPSSVIVNILEEGMRRGTHTNVFLQILVFPENLFVLFFLLGRLLLVVLLLPGVVGVRPDKQDLGHENQGHR